MTEGNPPHEPAAPRPTAVAGRLSTLCAALSMVGCVGCLLMLPTAYHLYTSVGLDFERDRGDRWAYTYLRVRWPGDGAFFVGGETAVIPKPDRPPDAVDLAATFFRPARRPRPRSFWNRLGFWVVVGERGLDARATSSFWIGVPSLVPVALLAVPPFYWLRRTRGRASHSRTG